MAQTMPSIEVIFKQMAVTAIQRSEKGVVCIVVNDDTEDTSTINEYIYSSDVKETEYTADNYKAITGAFIAVPNKVYVVKMENEKTFSDAAELIKNINFNWLVYLNAESGEQDKVSAYVQERNAKNNRHKIKCVTYKATTTDDKHVVNFTNEAITFKEETAAYPVAFYIARLAGVFAATPFTRAATYTELQELKSVAEPEDLNEAVGNGELVLFNDIDVVRIGTAVNSLTTVTADDTEDMQKITIVEGMDTITEDIVTTFNDYYVGKYKNTYDNQCLFLTAVNSYFTTLEGEGILDPNYENIAAIDVEQQRQQWLSTGKTEAADWDEQTVKNMTYKTWVNLAGDVKMLDAMENLKFVITMQ